MKYFGKPAAASNQSGSQRQGVLSKPGMAKSVAGKQGVLATGSKGKSRCASCGK